MAVFSLCFIVEILEETNQKLTFQLNDIASLKSILPGVDGQMSEADTKADLLMKHLHDTYFPEVHLELDGNGYNVSDRVRENFYIVAFTDVESAKLFLEKIDKILYDFRDTNEIRIDNNNAYINKEFFSKKVTDFSHEIIAYDMLKNLEF